MRIIVSAVALLSLCAIAPKATAQRVRGRVLHEAPPRTPIALVNVSLMNQNGALIADIRTDSTGIFSLRAPGPGRFKLRARRLGYEIVLSDEFALAPAEVLTFNFLLPSKRVELEPVTITDKRETERRLRLYGIDIRTINARRITRDKIDRYDDGFHTLADVIRLQNIPGLFVQASSTGEQCLYSGRASAGEHGGGCMKVFLDGAPLADLSSLEPASIELVLVVDAITASGLYGAGSENGVILLFSRGNAP